MNNVKKLFFGLAALAILCFFTAPVVWAGEIASDSLNNQWFKLKVKSAGYTYTSIKDASTDVTGKKIFKNKKVFMHLDWDEEYGVYDCQVYTRTDDSGDWEDSEGGSGEVMINTDKKYIILPMYFDGINTDKAELPIIVPQVYMKFKVKTNMNDEFKHSQVQSFTGTAHGFWSEEPEEEFVGNCTIIGNSVKVNKLPPGLQPEK